MIRIEHLPIDTKMVETSPYGFRDLEIGGIDLSMHNGDDFEAPIGTPLKNMAKGRVVYIGNNPEGYGIYIVIEHDGFCTLLAHLQNLIVNVNDDLIAGQLIGTTGDTGIGSAHLHVEIRLCDYSKFWQKVDSAYIHCVDPKPFLKACEQRNLLTYDEAVNIIKEKCGYNDKTIEFLQAYKYERDLIIKNAKAMI